MIALADDHDTYDTLIQLTKDVENDDYEPQLSPSNVDRHLEVRSGTGYVGMYNPRAICYMNSLLTQLFMNLEFRQFFMGLQVHEARGTQKLLFETQRLFTQMQSSYSRSTDPRRFAACVRSIDQEPIDVNVQMDVDEFFNLLFDQWEGQLLKDEHKERFRSFYGGKTLNQIKSKECKHVSERTEPFFAIQCDVMGKLNLQESLEAFVRGEPMEGDNKYKCESCGGKFVDAIKRYVCHVRNDFQSTDKPRTCLKDVPDNLIFHLKRFEFDLNDFSRRKINDHFEFPTSLNINAYHVDFLSDPSAPAKEDMFDLVGILVHTGTCENGHYYSYIRERPNPASTTEASWVEFDDSSVVPFDAAEIPSRAFGGMVNDPYSRQHMKPYSAYMLFYERRASIGKNQKERISPIEGEPAKVPAPQMLHQETADANRVFMQEYARFDPNHSKFVRQLYTTCHAINKGTCSESHDQEDNALHVVLAHLGQIVWRQKTSDIFLEMIGQLRRAILSCAKCCAMVLNTITTKEFPLLEILVRCGLGKIRTSTRIFIVDCLKTLREQEPEIYGLDNVESSNPSQNLPIPVGVLQRLARKLRRTAQETWKSTRGWDDFYLMLNQILEMGPGEVAALLNAGILHFCLNLFALSTLQHLESEEQELALIMGGKKVGVFNGLIGFLAAFLAHINLRSEPIASDSHDRLILLDESEMKFPINDEEFQFLFSWDYKFNALAVLDKVLELFDCIKTPRFLPGDILKRMLECPEFNVQLQIYNSILEGINLDAPYCDNYILAALAYCEATPIVEHIPKVITAVIKAIVSGNRNIEERGASSRAVNGFFFGLLDAENEGLFEQKHPHMFKQYLMQKARVYAVDLLMHPNEDVRERTQGFLIKLYTDCGDAPPETMFVRWKTIREVLPEMLKRIICEKDSGMMRVFLNSLVATCQALLQLLWQLGHSEDPEVERYKDDDDRMLFQEWTTQVEPRLRTWPNEIGTPISSAGHFEPSDYGSDSDGGPLATL